MHSFYSPARGAGGRSPSENGTDTTGGAERPGGSSGVVLIHGTLVTDALYYPFARKLSLLLGRPVHCYNRRGRAGSAPQPDDYSLATELADLGAVLRATGATDLVGHSYGGFIAMQAARTFPIRRMVTYDAAVSLSGNLAHRWRPELEESLTAGHLNSAWAHLVQGLGTAGPISLLPMGALRMLSIASARTPLGAQMRTLLPSAVLEMRSVLAADAEVHDFAGLTTPTLMLSGSWSPAYFAETGRLLAGVAPAVDFAEVPGQLHEGPIRPGKRLAVRMARFLAQTSGKPALRD